MKLKIGTVYHHLKYKDEEVIPREEKEPAHIINDEVRSNLVLLLYYLNLLESNSYRLSKVPKGWSYNPNKKLLDNQADTPFRLFFPSPSPNQIYLCDCRIILFTVHTQSDQKRLHLKAPFPSILYQAMISYKIFGPLSKISVFYPLSPFSLLGSI